MKRIIKAIRRWRYRRLYRKLFVIYAQRYESADYCGEEASNAFEWITGKKWEDISIR